MDSMKNSFSNVPYAFIFLLFSSLGVIQFYQTPLENPTPTIEVDVAVSQSNAHQKIPAKIWEDPFQAADSVIRSKSLPFEETTPQYLLRGLFEKLNSGCNDTCDWQILAQKKIHIYTIPLSVDAWSTSQETRIKRRYAAHMALYRQGYIPTQASSIHSLCLAEVSCEPDRYIHYEILSKSSEQSNRVDEIAVLLWARNSVVSQEPARFFKSMSSAILKAAKESFGVRAETRELLSMFDFVGFWPPNSGGLSQLSTLLKKKTESDEIQNEKAIHFKLVNYSATVPLSIIAQRSGKNHLSGLHDMESMTYRSSVELDERVPFELSFQSVIADDSQVIKRLLKELFEQRGFSVQDSVFVLVTEWESIYSREMASAFQRLCNAEIRDKSSEVQCDIRRFPYISGISGDSHYSASATKVKSDKNEEIRLPVGSGQYDYIRRLAKAFNKDLADKRNTVFALFGSSLDDKLLLLQAIRESNTESTIITTDINAVYTSLVRKFKIRNLLIGTSYSLKTPQTQVAPFTGIQFRDNYQTSLFQAISYTLNNVLPNKSDIHRSIELYEVGKSDFMPLVLGAERNSSGETDPVPAHESRILIANIVIPLALLGLLWGIAWLNQNLLNHAELNKPGALAAFEKSMVKALSSKSNLFKKIGGSLIIYTIFFNIIFIGFVFSGQLTTESSELFSGISIWVSEIGRALAVIVILFSITVSWSKLRQWRERISHRYLGGFQAEPNVDWLPLVSIKNELIETKQGHIYKRINFTKSWSFFYNELRAKNIGVKCIYILLLFVGLWLFVAIGQYGSSQSLPAHPIARGAIATCYDRFFATISTVLLTLHIAYATIITYVCGRLVSLLSRGVVSWPQVYLDKLEQEYSKDRETVKNLYSEYNCIKLIGNVTNTIGPQVVVPFVGLFLIIVTRNSYFDNWNFPVSILSFFSVSGAILLWCASWLRMLAARAKRNALERLVIQKTRYLEDSTKSRNADYVITLIQDYRKGAFSGWKDNPIVAAIMLPVSSVIGVNIIPW